MSYISPTSTQPCSELMYLYLCLTTKHFKIRALVQHTGPSSESPDPLFVFLSLCLVRRLHLTLLRGRNPQRAVLSSGFRFRSYLLRLNLNACCTRAVKVFCVFKPSTLVLFLLKDVSEKLCRPPYITSPLLAFALPRLASPHLVVMGAATSESSPFLN